MGREDETGHMKADRPGQQPDRIPDSLVAQQLASPHSRIGLIDLAWPDPCSPVPEPMLSWFGRMEDDRAMAGRQPWGGDRNRPPLPFGRGSSICLIFMHTLLVPILLSLHLYHV